MKSHSCSEVRGVVVSVFTHSNCDYRPSKVMPFMEPTGRYNRRPLLVHGFTLSTLNTWVELPDRDAEHHEDAPLLAAGLCPAAKCELNYVLPNNLSSVHRAANPVNYGMCVIKDRVLPPANEPSALTKARSFTVICMTTRSYI